MDKVVRQRMDMSD